MTPQPAILLGLGLCLGQLIHQLSGAWSKPSISAEPGLTIPLGQNMTFVCRSPETFSLFRLQKEGIKVKDEKNTSLNQTEMRFPMGPVEASMAGRYSCVYLTSHVWSDYSEALELVVAPEEVTQASDPDSAVPSGSPSSKGEGWKPQERPGRPQRFVFSACRLSRNMEDLETTPDNAKVDRLAGKDAQVDPTVLAAGSGQDVTYAQLDQRALMQRAAPPMEPSAESSTYATLAGC
ncbi:leukocyte-associated immunoglobulin-like receptor 2 [Ochotona princeps]|uniref:leukocyte-associated immunoglobulin-like receptor 2 n=1 Tax=Ochotona princeps TaxID=9978 RepID=UPI00271529A2|nr:leukocyte-associated immunoglobulin-like receptor 2 [Ochotona princeps]